MTVRERLFALLLHQPTLPWRLPTLAQLLGVDAPLACGGRSFFGLVKGEALSWRRDAHYEWDSRDLLIRNSQAVTGEQLAKRNLTASVSDELAYVQFGLGPFKCYDVAADPTWRTKCRDRERILQATQAQLMWRPVHQRQELANML